MEFDINKNSYCLTINDDRYMFLCNRFRKVGITPPIKFNGFKACRHIHYVRANTYGQLSIIQYAKQLNLPYVIIYEDDAFPRNNILSKLQIITNDIYNLSCDILYLGRNGDAALWNDQIERLHGNDLKFKEKMSNPIEINKSVCRISKNIFGNHAYIVFNKGYDKAIETLLTSLVCVNMCYSDIYLSSLGLLDILCVSEPLFIQYDKTKSECIHQSDFNNNKGYPITETLQAFNNKDFSL